MSKMAGYKDQSIGVGVSGMSVVPAALLKKSSPGPKRCGHSGLPGTIESWPSLATAATRKGHGCECQSLEALARKEFFFPAGQQAHGQTTQQLGIILTCVQQIPFHGKL